MAINKITITKLDEIKRNSVMSLPDEPSKVGIGSTALKERFVAPIAGASNSIAAEVNRIVDETNMHFNQVSTNLNNMDANLATKITNQDMVDYVGALNSALQSRLNGG